jgi:NADH-quinone oxidoreductase subunit C
MSDDVKNDDVKNNDVIKPEGEESKVQEVQDEEVLAKETVAEEAVAENTNAEPVNPAEVEAQDEDAEKAAKKKAAEEARAARAEARAKAAEAEAGEEEKPKEPSPNQPKLDRLVQIIKEQVGEAAVVEASINERDRHLPTVVIEKSYWPQTAALLKSHEELKLEYLRNVSGTDQETHMEVTFYLIQFSEKQDYCVKVKTDREDPVIPSVTSVWQTANWNEREIYDLLGISFTDHPDMRRIMLPDDWVGHPLRKDYEPLDPEV